MPRKNLTAVIHLALSPRLLFLGFFWVVFFLFLRWLASDGISLACVGDFSSGSISPNRDGQPSPINFPQPANTHHRRDGYH